MNNTDLTTLAPPMALALASNFGSVDQWVDSIVSLVSAHGTAGGEVRLAFDPDSGSLGNHWAPDATRRSALIPLLAIALPSPEDPVAGLDWPLAYQRYQDAVHAASERFAATDGGGESAGALVLDVRRAGVFEAAPTMLPGATWRDPSMVPVWAPQLPPDRPVLVYCVYGHEVGRVTAMRLQALGVDARFLAGGIDAWQRAGRATVARPGAPA